MNHDHTKPAAVLGLSVALGLTLAGFAIGHAINSARSADRYVTVKGLSEKEVAADLVVWPIAFNTTGSDLALLQSNLETAAKKVGEFLKARGFSPEEFSLSSPRVTDFEAQGGFRGGMERPANRYMVEAAITLRSGKVKEVREAMQSSGDLIKQGVALVRSYEQNTTYLYTALDKIKPEMIAEATRDARRAAEKFAVDSGSRVGAIRNAQQGYFNIEDRDPFSPEFKKIRVVTTVQYFLKD
jgi:uncharacterized protein